MKKEKRSFYDFCIQEDHPDLLKEWDTEKNLPLTPQQVTWWLGGAEAGAPYNQSLTYARYPNAVEANPKFTDTEIEEAIQKGKIVFIDTFDTVKVCTDINTLTSFTVDKQSCFAKNRVMRVLNQFCNDVYLLFSLLYFG